MSLKTRSRPQSQQRSTVQTAVCGSDIVVVAWVENRDKSGCISWYDEKPVFPSKIQQTAPNDNTITRNQQPEAGTAEECELFLQHSGKAYVAYPVKDGETYLLPGYYVPVKLKWYPSDEDKTTVMTAVPKPGSEQAPTYLRVFANARPTIWLPDQCLVNQPTVRTVMPKEETISWINWISTKGWPIGYAYDCIINKMEQPSEQWTHEEYNFKTPFGYIVAWGYPIENWESSTCYYDEETIVVNVSFNLAIKGEVKLTRRNENFYIKIGDEKEPAVRVYPKFPLGAFKVDHVIHGSDAWIVITTK